MSAQRAISALTLQEQVDLAGLEGSLTWLQERIQGLARSEEPADGLTPEAWAEIAAAGEQLRGSITELLDHIAQQQGAGR